MGLNISEELGVGITMTCYMWYVDELVNIALNWIEYASVM